MTINVGCFFCKHIQCFALVVTSLFRKGQISFGLELVYDEFVLQRIRQSSCDPSTGIFASHMSFVCRPTFSVTDRAKLTWNLNIDNMVSDISIWKRWSYLSCG